MPFFNFPQRWTRQPQGPVRIDWGNPFTKGLRGLIYVGPGGARDLISLVRPGDSLIYGGSADGFCGTANGGTNSISSSYVEFPGFCQAGPLTYSILWNLAGTGGSTGAYTGCTDSGTGYFIGTHYGLQRMVGVANNMYIDGSGDWTTGKLSLASLTYDRANVYIYDGGFNVGSGSASGDCGFSTYSTLIAGVGPYGYGYLNGTVYYLGIWDRSRSAAEEAELASNPWQLFAPLQRRIYFGAATGAPTNYPLPCNTATYTMTGNATILKKGSVLITTAGTYSMTGNAANLVWKRVLTAATNSYVMTGNAAALTKQWKLTAAAGSYTMTGNTITLNYSGVAHSPLTAAAGSYAYTGNAANLVWKRVLTAATVAYTMTGNAVAFKKGNTLTAATASYTMTGNAAALKKTYVLVCDTASYVMTGRAATLRYPGGAGGLTIRFIGGVSKEHNLVQIDPTYGVEDHNVLLTDAGGGTYTLEDISTVSEDRRDSVSHESYEISG